MLSFFTSNSFFNDRKEKVYHYKSEVVNTEGVLIQTLTKVGEISFKVIRPYTNKEVSNKTLVSQAILHTHKQLNFYKEENSSDLILWKDKYYKITKEWDRREYGFRYELEYMYINNSDE